MDASLHGKLEKKWKLSVNSYINAAKSTCQGNKRENRSTESETKKKPKRNRDMENKKLENWKTKQNKRQTDRATRKCCQSDTLTRQHYCSPSCSLSLCVPFLCPFPLPLLSFIYCSFGSCQDLLQDTCDRSVRAAVKDFFMLNTAAVYWWRQQHRKQCDISWSKLAHLYTNTHTNAHTCVCNNNNKWVTKHHKEF